LAPGIVRPVGSDVFPPIEETVMTWYVVCERVVRVRRILLPSADRQVRTEDREPGERHGQRPVRGALPGRGGGGWGAGHAHLPGRAHPGPGPGRGASAGDGQLPL